MTILTPARNSGDALWSPLAHMPSVLGNRTVVVSGSGSYVTTAEGQTLLDATSGLWHANVGHGRTEIADAARRQLATLETYQSFGSFTNDAALRLSDRLAGLSPIADPKIILTSGGSDSVEAAVKLARRHWQLEGQAQKTFVLSRADSYHGLHAFGSSLSGPDFYRDGYGPTTLVPETARFSSTDIDDFRRLVEEIGAERIAAVITEPVIGSGGIIAPPEGYFEQLQTIARENDILLIVDEVITGFGRTGRLFASERFALQPDLLVVAKGITSGYAALGAVFVAPRIWQRFFTGDDAPVYRHGVTYSGHATACVIAEANLDIIEREDLVAESARLEGVLDTALDGLRGRDDVREIRSGAGFLAGVAPVDDVPAEAIARYALAEGIILRVLRENLIQISPPFITSDADVARIVDVIAGGLDHVR
jgi:adenosylmethionine-8-amino-7-oxononanoate aminotransferase